MIIYCDTLDENRAQTFCDVCQRPMLILTWIELMEKSRTQKPVRCWECTVWVEEHALIKNSKAGVVELSEIKKWAHVYSFRQNSTGTEAKDGE